MPYPVINSYSFSNGGGGSSVSHGMWVRRSIIDVRSNFTRRKIGSWFPIQLDPAVPINT